MSPRSMPPAIVASTVALAVAAGPLAAAAYGDDGNGNNGGTGYSAWGTGQPTKDPGQGRPEGPEGRPQGPEGPQQGPGDELDGSYDGEVITTEPDMSKQADRAAADGVRDAVPVRRGVDRHDPRPATAPARAPSTSTAPTTSATRSSRPLPAWSPPR